jgi:hypothetical protein
VNIPGFVPVFSPSMLCQILRQSSRPGFLSLESLVYPLQVPPVPLFLPSVYSSLGSNTLVVTVLPTFFWFWPEAINLAVPQSLAGRCHGWPNSISGSRSSYLSLHAMTLTLCSFTGANGQRLNLASGPCQTDGSVLTRPSPAATVAVRVHGPSLLP